MPLILCIRIKRKGEEDREMVERRERVREGRLPEIWNVNFFM